MRKRIVILIEDLQSQFYDFLMKGFSLKAKIEDIDLIYLTAHKIPAFCSDLVGYSERDDRDYQFQSIYNYADFAAASGVIIAYDCCNNNDYAMKRDQIEAMFEAIPRVYIDMEGSRYDDATSIDRGYSLGKRSIAKIVDMMSSGEIGSETLVYEATQKAASSNDTSLESGSLDEAELYATINEYANKNLLLRTQSWGISFMTRDLIEYQGSIEDNFRLFLNKLTILGLRDTHFFLIREHNEYAVGEKFIQPNDIFYAGGITSKGPTDVVWQDYKSYLVTKADGFSEYLPEDGKGDYQAYLLFSGDTQYGLMFVKDNPKDRENPLYMSLQIGNLMKLVYMKHKQSETSKEMAKTLERIKESNQILSVISKYDELTNILNRRGFMEEAISKIHINSGKKACVIFADLDHLKEINDSFGHADGDFAITTAASLLTGIIPKSGVCARIGGDEFVAFIPLNAKNEKEQVESIKAKLKDASFAFNITCNKPYFVELSVGYHIFTCEDGIDLADIISQSDSWLYEDKQRRRASIKKNI